MNGGRKPLEPSRSAALQTLPEGARQLQLWDGVADATAWRVRQSRRARRLAARVFRDGSVEIVVPLRTSAATVSSFVARHRPWIEQQQARVRPAVPEPFPPRQIDLTALGQRWQCGADPALRPGKVRVVQEPDAQGAGQLLFGGTEADSGKLLRGLRMWLIERARLELVAPLGALAARMGTGPVQLKVRRQRTRWGSCTVLGTVSLNCCALFQRPAVLHYLLVHELSHLRHMNHSARFWAHVEHFEPDYRALDRELSRGWQQVPRWALALRPN